jgi:predicted enzyme related to lactoylglutathione lyase
VPQHSPAIRGGLSIRRGPVRRCGEGAINAPKEVLTMGNQVAHVEIRSSDPDASRAFYGRLFDWSFPEAPEPGYTYIESGIQGAVPGGIGRAPGGPGQVTFFVDVADVQAALAAAEHLGGRIVLPATSVPGVTFGLFADPQGLVLGVSHNG